MSSLNYGAASIPLSVRTAYGLAEADAALNVRHVPSLINLTFIVQLDTTAGPEPIVLQRMHPVFGPNVHFDIEAVTAHLRHRQLETPQLLHTRAGQLWTTEDSTGETRVWRALSYMAGITIHTSKDPSSLGSAAELLGRFHRALADLEHEFVHERPLHDTQKHLSNLTAALASETGQNDREAQDLGAEILGQVDGLRLDFGAFPRRVIHGDPKLSNILFQATPPHQARCMIDLDTVGRGYLAYELGDALRSWCNSAGEDTRAARVDPEAFRAVISGYVRACPSTLTHQELLSGIDGLETVSLELASRFAADVVWDRYWGWDAARFGSRREHNLVRAQGQLALSRSVRSQRALLHEIAAGALAAGARPLTSHL